MVLVKQESLSIPRRFGLSAKCGKATEQASVYSATPPTFAKTQFNWKRTAVEIAHRTASPAEFSAGLKVYS